MFVAPLCHRTSHATSRTSLRIGTNGQVKLSDFNSARVNTQKSEAAMTYVGTAMYMSVCLSVCQ